MNMLKRTVIVFVIAATVWGSASAQQARNGAGPGRNGNGDGNANGNFECDGSGPRQGGAAQDQRRGRGGRGRRREGGQRGGGRCGLAQDMGAISDVEIGHVLYMRQEEKLARDVYRTLHELWASDIFDRIAGSEQRHMDAIARVMDAQNLSDPVSDDTLGVYEDPAFAEMYADLIEAGGLSYVDALKTGAYIEELDILDLKKCLEDVENEYLIRVFENLMRGSRNHLRAFASALAQEGEIYVPKLMTAEQYDEIVNVKARRGRGWGRNRGGRS